jgi:pSer/pThr/pTyr-binding forkhead associated (FHA) protein
MAQLIDRSGGRSGAISPLGIVPTGIGRSGENAVVLVHERVSRRHAQVEWDGEQYLLRDLGSRNGTALNGRRIERPTPLHHGDLIGIGGFTLFFDAADETVGTEEEPAQAGLRVDLATARVWVDARQVQLTAKEFLALRALYERSEALVTKEDLATAVWPEYQGSVGDYNIEQVISRLRRKLEPEPERPRHLLTVRGLGYRLVR